MTKMLSAEVRFAPPPKTKRKDLKAFRKFAKLWDNVSQSFEEAEQGLPEETSVEILGFFTQAGAAAQEGDYRQAGYLLRQARRAVEAALAEGPTAAGPTVTVEPAAVAALAEEVRKGLDGRPRLDSRKAIMAAHKGGRISAKEAEKALRQLGSGDGSKPATAAGEELTPELAQAAIDAGKCPYDGTKLTGRHRLCDRCFKAGKLPALKRLLGQGPKGQPGSRPNPGKGKGRSAKGQRDENPLAKPLKIYERLRAEIEQAAALDPETPGWENLAEAEALMDGAKQAYIQGVYRVATAKAWDAVRLLELPGLLAEAKRQISALKADLSGAPEQAKSLLTPVNQAWSKARNPRAKLRDRAEAARRIPGMISRIRQLVNLNGEVSQPKAAPASDRPNGRSANAAQIAQQRRTLDQLRQQAAAAAAS